MDWRILNAKKTARRHRWWILAMGGCWIDCTTRNSHRSTRLFVIYQQLAGWRKRNHVRLFADDCILYSKVAGPEDASSLQKDLDTLTSWQNKWQMAFNAQKCYILHFTHSHTPYDHTYTLTNTVLQEVPSYTYLGVDISKDLTWNSHVDRISSKANRTLGFLRRNLYLCPPHIKDMAYKTLVRPILDYCSSVWDPHTQTLINQLEAIQNRAARFVSGDYRRKSSVTAMKKELNWEELTLRRKVNRLTTFHQAVAGHLAIPVQTLLRPVERNLRHSSPAANIYQQKLL